MKKLITIASAAILLLSAANAQDNVLYELDFASQADSGLPEGWTQVEGSAEQVRVLDGVLELDARSGGPVRVLLPDELAQYGDYMVEAEVTHAEANEPTRWNSIMFRVQDADYPYYQMAVRQNAAAANGVEFAERTPANSWNVPTAAPYDTAIDGATYYTYTLKTHGNRVQELIDGTVVVDTDLAVDYSDGHVGFQSNGSLMRIRNVRVSVQDELPPMPPTPADGMVQVTEPATGVSVAPTVVLEFTDAAQADASFSDALPATVILHVDADLNVLDASAAVVTSLAEAMDFLDQRAIPAFYVSNAAAATSLSGWLSDNIVVDAFVASNEPELVTELRRAHPLLRGIIDYRAASELDLMDVRREANTNLSRIVLLPQHIATKENVEFLQRLLMTVWVGEQATDVPAGVNQFNLVVTGVNGIVTSDAAGLIDVLGNAFPQEQVTLARKPLIIGHRGIPGLAPENTLEGAWLAFERGSDMIENDIYVTTDGAVVIHHDETLERTTTGSGSIAEYSLIELMNVLANNQFPAEFPYAGIPTLNEFFAAFLDLDVVHVVEIKTADPSIIEPTVELIRTFDAEDQVVAISFHADQIRLLHEHMPGMSAGFLTGGQVNEAAPLRSVYNVLEVVQPLNSTYNPNYGGLGRGFLEAAKHRGITSWPWTFRNHDEYIDMFLAGLNGLTTDDSHWSETWIDGVSAQDSLVETPVGSSVELTADVSRYDRSSGEVIPEVVVLDGADLISVDGAVITGESEGTAWVALRYWQDIDSDRGYFMYSGAVQVGVVAD